MSNNYAVGVKRAEYLLSVTACEQGYGTNKIAFQAFVSLLQTLDAASPAEKPPLLGLILQVAGICDDKDLCAQAAAAACELACSCRDPVCALVLSDTLQTAVLQHSKVRPPHSVHLDFTCWSAVSFPEFHDVALPAPSMMHWRTKGDHEMSVLSILRGLHVQHLKHGMHLAHPSGGIMHSWTRPL